MKTLMYEGFKIETDINEATPYVRMYEDMEEGDIIGELIGIIDSAIDAIISGEKLNLSRGYKSQYSHCEPYKVRNQAKKTIVDYTGSQGGSEYTVIIHH